MPDSSRLHELRLRRYLAARLGPLTLLLVAALSLSPAAAYLVVGSSQVRERADLAAEQMARAVAGEIQQRPRLWRYDRNKLRRHVELQLEQRGIEAAEIFDARGRRVSFGQEQPAAPDELLWARRPVPAVGRQPSPAQVWVGASLDDVERQAALLLFAFAFVGMGLGGVMYFLPLAAISTAESRIAELIRELRHSQRALENFNQTLEQQVAERSVELAEALDQVQRQEQRLRELSARTVTLQEAERRALSRELHDSAGQTLTAIRIDLQMLALQLTSDPKLSALADRAIGSTDATLEEIRRVVHRLAPAILDDLGLVNAIRRHCDDFAELASLEVTPSFEGFQEDTNALSGEWRLGSGLEAACFRIVQEALTNVARHAQASHVTVELRLGEDELWLRVRDDGRGLDPQSQQRNERRGLAGIAERVELLGGVFALSSEPGAGTSLEVRLPVPSGGPAQVSVEADSPV